MYHLSNHINFNHIDLNFVLKSALTSWVYTLPKFVSTIIKTLKKFKFKSLDINKNDADPIIKQFWRVCMFV